MVEFVVDILVEQLISVAIGRLGEEISLLKEVETELDNMRRKMQFVQTVLEDAEYQGLKDKIVKLWLKSIQDVFYDMDDVMDEWSTRVLIRKRANEIVGSLSCLSSKQLNCCSSIKQQLNCCSSVTQLPWRRDIALRIKGINQRMNLVFSEMDQFKLVSKAVPNDGLRKFINHNDIPRTTTSFVDESNVFGRNKDKDILLGKVLSVNTEEEKSLRVISIVGVGGLGKTTLAQLVYNDEKVKEKFDKKKDMGMCLEPI